MKLTKLQAILGAILASIAVAGYALDAGDYYQPQDEAEEEHAAIASWNELDSIKHQVEVLKLKIQRITDMATLQRRPLTASEEQQIESYRQEIALHNGRKLALMKGK